MIKKNHNLYTMQYRNHQSFYAAFSGLLVVILIFFFLIGWCPVCGSSRIRVPEVKNIDDEPSPGDLPTIIINRYGDVFCGEDKIDNFSELPKKIEQEIMFIKSVWDKLVKGGWDKKYHKWNKVLLKADERLQFGKIIEVLRCLPNAQIRTVGLLADEAIE
jgi:biopolymer transport protein ExbD